MVMGICAAGAGAAQDLRVASFNASLARSGPGLLYKELGEDPVPPQVRAVIGIIAEVAPDILLINEFDHDAGGAALARFQAALAAGGIDYPHVFAAPVNTGIPSGLDLDRDGQRAGPRDALGYGLFPGQYGMAVLSRHPIGRLRSFTEMAWADLPGALLPVDADGAPFPSLQAHRILRLSSKGHWDLEIRTPWGALALLASHPTPPVFDGPEDFNGRRNHDEIRFWRAYVNGARFADDQGSDRARDPGPFVILGDLNADPLDGDGLRAGIAGLLADPALRDPAPRSAGGAAAALAQGGANARHRGDPARDTADWNDAGPGNLRVDYVLPSADLVLRGAGVFWPAPDDPLAALLAVEGEAASDHRLVWVDISLP